MTHDILTLYSVKATEYLIVVVYLFLFVPFWRYVNAEKGLAVAVAGAGEWVDQLVGWFRVPEQLHFHPGHAWVRVDGGDVVTVGMDDFAHRLVGRIPALALPAVGARLGQGERGWSLHAGCKSVDMLSPVDGTVVEVNDRMKSDSQAGLRDPYGDGWLFKVRAPRIQTNLKQLLSGTLAKRWMEEVCEGLRSRMDPVLGQVYQDGGLPVEGMALSLDPAHWDEVARSFFLS